VAKRTKKDKSKLALRRLAEDEHVHAQLRVTAVRLREAWGRVAARRPRSKAVEDKKLYTKLREAATAFTEAVRTLGRPPEPPKRRGRKVALVAAGAGGAAYVVNRRRSGGDETPPAG
jgi:ferric-dicitrate binding protein FerR (iron transport regulator)